MIFTIFISTCSFFSQSKEYFPVWWQEEQTELICSYGIGIHHQQHISRLAAQNNAYYEFPEIISKYLNDYVATNCIEPGDEQIQKELDRIFQNFNNYYINIESTDISLGFSEQIELKIKGKKSYKNFVQLHINNKDLHKAFVKFLETSDLYILPKLRNILKDCFRE